MLTKYWTKFRIIKSKYESVKKFKIKKCLQTRIKEVMKKINSKRNKGKDSIRKN